MKNNKIQWILGAVALLVLPLVLLPVWLPVPPELLLPVCLLKSN